MMTEKHRDELLASVKRRIGPKQHHLHELLFQQLWFEYLKLSPSYEIARRIRMGTLRDIDKSSMPNDIDRVLAVFDDFGEVNEIRFSHWWEKRGQRFLDFDGLHKVIQNLGLVNGGSIEISDSVKMVVEITVSEEMFQSCQPTLIVAIPLNMREDCIADQIGSTINSIKILNSNSSILKDNYKLEIERKNHSSLYSYLHTVWIKSIIPDNALWRIGTTAKLSHSYSNVLDENMEVKAGQDRYDREMLSILTSRALFRVPVRGSVNPSPLGDGMQ